MSVLGYLTGVLLESNLERDALVRGIEEAFGDVLGAAAPSSSEIEPWCPLDAQGFRAALPTAMIGVLRGDGARGLRWWLTLPLSGDEEIYLSKWSALDARQRACVGRFLLTMADASLGRGLADEASLWEEAYESHWDGS